MDHLGGVTAFAIAACMVSLLSLSNSLIAEVTPRPSEFLFWLISPQSAPAVPESGIRTVSTHTAMRLSSLPPEILPATLVDALQTLGIVSEADLLFSASVPEVWRKLPSNLIPLSELVHCVKVVMDRCAVPRFVATRADGRSLSDEQKPETSAGVGDLDNLLGTTLRDSVVEVSGRHGSGASVRSSLSEAFLFAAQIYLPPGFRRLSHYRLYAITCR